MFHIYVRNPIPPFIANYSIKDQDPCDANNVVTLSIIGQNSAYFFIDGTVIRASTKIIDYEEVGNRFDITLIAKDNGFPALETSFIVEIIVMDKNDEIPSI